MAMAGKEITEKAKTAKSEASDSANDISEDFQSLRDDVDELLRHIGTFAKAETDVGVSVVKTTRDKAVKRGEETLDYSRDFIRDNPLVACAAALGAGFVAAMLMRR